MSRGRIGTTAGIDPGPRGTGDLLNALSTMGRHGELAKAHMNLVKNFPAWRARQEEYERTGVLRRPAANHMRDDARRILAAGKRRAEADEWIKQVKARKQAGVKVKSGVHEGDRCK